MVTSNQPKLSTHTKLPIRRADKAKWEAIKAVKGWSLVVALSRVADEFMTREGITLPEDPKPSRRRAAV